MLDRSSLTGIVVLSTFAISCATPGDSKGESTALSNAPLTSPLPPLLCRVDADRTGKADATAALNDALECSTKNGLAQVNVPPGTYAVSSKLVVPVGVSVVGDSNATLSFPGGFSDDAIELSDRASISGLNVTFASAQAAGKAAVLGKGIGANIQKMRITNAAIGVYTPLDVNSGRIYVNQVAVYESTIGVWSEFGLDVSRFENIHVERTAVAPNTYGVIFGRNDYMLASKISTARLAVGAEFRDTSAKESTLGSFTAYTSRGCTQGLSIRGGSRVSASNLAIDAQQSALVVADSGTISVSASRLASVVGSAVSLSATGSLTLSGSIVERTDTSSGDHGIAVNGGRFLNVTGNSIASNGHGVYFFASPQRGVVAANTFNLINPSGRGVFGTFDANVSVTGNGSNQ